MWGCRAQQRGRGGNKAQKEIWSCLTSCPLNTILPASPLNFLELMHSMTIENKQRNIGVLKLFQHILNRNNLDSGQQQTS